MNDQIPAVNIELIEDGIEKGLIVLNTCIDWEPMEIKIHPLHVRYIAEKIGLIETSDPQAAKTIAKLERRLLMLRDRIDHIADWLVNHSDSEHANLSYEQTYATATADIAAEFCAELYAAPICAGLGTSSIGKSQ